MIKKARKKDLESRIFEWLGFCFLTFIAMLTNSDINLLIWCVGIPIIVFFVIMLLPRYEEPIEERVHQRAKNKNQQESNIELSNELTDVIHPVENDHFIYAIGEDGELVKMDNRNYPPTLV